MAQTLANIGVEILSTGGTEKALRNANIPVTNVSDYTQFPEIMGPCEDDQSTHRRRYTWTSGYTF